MGIRVQSFHFLSTAWDSVPHLSTSMQRLFFQVKREPRQRGFGEVLNGMIAAEDIQIVELEPFELSRAAFLGVQRQVHSLFVSKQDKNSCLTGEDFSCRILEACGELALAKALGLYWRGALGEFTVPGIGPIKVRTTDSPGGSLVLHKTDPDEQPFVLVVGQNASFRIVGWIYGREGKNERFWRTEDVQSPAYLVNPKRSKEARSLFRPISTLIDLVKQSRK